MRDFRRKPGRLSALPLGARFLYSIWLAYALVALIVAAALYQDGPTLDREQVATYYTGVLPEPAATSAGEAVRGAGAEDSGGDLRPSDAEHVGPTIELPTMATDSPGPALDLDGLDSALPRIENSVGPSGRIAMEFNRRRLLEITHGHLFMMPLFFLVIAHIFVLVGTPRLVTMAFVLVGALSIGAHIAAPWLVRDCSRGWAFLMPASGVGMLASLGGMSLISLVAMWLPTKRPRPTPTAGT